MKTRLNTNKYYIQTSKESNISPFRKGERRDQTQCSLTNGQSQTFNKISQDTSPKLPMNRRAAAPKLSLRLPKVQRFLDKIHGSGHLSSPLYVKNNIPATATILTTIKSAEDKGSSKMPRDNPIIRRGQKFYSQNSELEKLLKKHIGAVGSSNHTRNTSKNLKDLSEISVAISNKSQINRCEVHQKEVHTEDLVINFNDIQLQLIDLTCDLDKESDRRTYSSATFTGTSNTPRFALNKPSNLQSIAAQLSRRALEETPVFEDLSESFYGRPKCVYVFEANQNSSKLSNNLKL